MHPQQNAAVAHPLVWPARHLGAPVIPERQEPPRARHVTRRPLPGPNGAFHLVLLMAPTAWRTQLAAALWADGALVTLFDNPHHAAGVLVGDHVDAVVVDAALGEDCACQVAQWLRGTGKQGIAWVVLTDGNGLAWRHQGPVVLAHPRSALETARMLTHAMGLGAPAWR